MAVDATVSLISLDAVKEYLKITADTEDAVLERMIDQVSSWANDVTGRHIKERTITEYCDGDGSAELILGSYPVQQIISLHDDPNRVFDGSSQIDVPRDVVLNSASGVIRLWNQRSAFTKGVANIRVIYRAGYPEVAVPHDIRLAVLKTIAHQYRHGYADGKVNIVTDTIGDRTLTFSQEPLPVDAREILKTYRRASSPMDWFV